MCVHCCTVLVAGLGMVVLCVHCCSTIPGYWVCALLLDATIILCVDVPGVVLPHIFSRGCQEYCVLYFGLLHSQLFS